MTVVNPPKVLNLPQLKDELATAGITVNTLGAVGNPATEVFTYGDAGVPVDLPPEATPVIQAHVAGPDASLVAELNAIAGALNNSTAYLDPTEFPTPTDDQIARATAQRGYWATILHVQPLTIPVTQAATAADIHPL